MAESVVMNTDGLLEAQRVSLECQQMDPGSDRYRGGAVLRFALRPNEEFVPINAPVPQQPNSEQSVEDALGVQYVAD